MINTYDLVPLVYTSASRDFQYLCWLINVVLNSVKHNVDDLYYLPSAKSDSQLAVVLAATLGFNVKRHYDQAQLEAIAGILPMLLKYKGTEKAITIAGEALIKASGSAGRFRHNVTGSLLEVTLPADLVDVTLFKDLLPYILPAGMTCHITKNTQVPDTYKTEVGYTDIVKEAWIADLEWDTKRNTTTGLAGLFEASEKPEFSNYLSDTSDGKLKVNAGLLSNTVIPILNNPTHITHETDKEG